jgi:hypothetical protein
MPPDRRIQYRVVNGMGIQVGDVQRDLTDAQAVYRYWLPMGAEPRVQQRTITVGPWTDVEGDETDE